MWANGVLVLKVNNGGELINMALFDMFGRDYEEAESDLPTLRDLLSQFNTGIDEQYLPNTEEPRTEAPSPEQLIQGNIAEMGKKQREDMGAHSTSPTGNVNAPQNFSMDELYKLNNAAEGWKEVPGTESFTNPGRPGRYRVDAPLKPGERTRADVAADELRSYNKGKYGGSGNYGGAGAEVLTRSENIADLGRQTFAAGEGKRRELESQVANIERLLQNAFNTGTTDSPVFDQLQKQLAGLQGMSSARSKADTAALAGSTGSASQMLAPLAEMQKEQQQREEYAALADMLRGKGSSMQKGFPGGMSKASYDQAGKVISGQREERRLDNADRAFEATINNRNQTREDKMNRPMNPSAASVKLNREQYLPPGTSIAKLAGQEVLVKSGTTTPVPNGEMYLRQATQRAQQALSQRGGGANPAVVKHPAVQAITEMLRAEKEGTLEPHRAILLQRFKQNHLSISKELMKNGQDERSANEQALILAAGDVVGMR